MKILTRAFGRIAASAALLAAPLAHADPVHFWQFHVNGRYGYVQSQFVNACANVTWEDCKQPILWFRYAGAAKLSTLVTERPKLGKLIARETGNNLPDQYDDDLEIIFVVTPGPDHYVVGQGAAAHETLMILDSAAGTQPTNVVLINVYGDGSMQASTHDLDRGATALQAYQDVVRRQVTVGAMTSSDHAELQAMAQQAKQHPAPKHWWIYAADGVYGYVPDASDPTCTPDWKQCKRPLHWLMYEGQKADGTNVFVLFRSPTDLFVQQQQASPLTFYVDPHGQRDTMSFLNTDGSAIDQPYAMTHGSGIWMAEQDAVHGQLQPAQPTSTELASVRAGADAFNRSQSKLMAKEWKSYVNRKEVIVHTEP